MLHKPLLMTFIAVLLSCGHTSPTRRQASGFDDIVAKTISPREEVPATPERPEGIADSSFHGNDFVFLAEKGWGPAVEAAPVWLFSRTLSTNVFLIPSRPHAMHD